MDSKIAKTLVDYIKHSQSTRIKSASIISNFKKEAELREQKNEAYRDKVASYITGLVESEQLAPMFKEAAIEDLASNPEKMFQLLISKEAGLNEYSMGKATDEYSSAGQDPILAFCFGD